MAIAGAVSRARQVGIRVFMVGTVGAIGEASKARAKRAFC
jgi:hypothetical protein